MEAPDWVSLVRQAALPSPSHLGAPHISLYHNFKGAKIKAENCERPLAPPPYWKNWKQTLQICKQANLNFFTSQVACNAYHIVLITWTVYLWTVLMFSVDFTLHSEIFISK